MESLSFAVVSRRASCVALSAMGMATLARPLAGDARKKKRKKGDVNKLCKTQIGACETAVTASCGGNAECLAEETPCCQLLATCDFTGFLACLQAAQAN